MENRRVDYKKNSYFRRSFLVYFSVIMLTLTGISFSFYRTNNLFLQDYIHRINQQHIESIGQLMNSIFYRTSYFSAVISENQSVSRLLDKDLQTVLPDSTEQKVQEILSLISLSNPEISSIYLYIFQDDRIISERSLVDREDFWDTGWLDHISGIDPIKPKLIYRRTEIFNTPQISLVRRIDVQGEIAGGLIINIDIAALQRILGRDNIEKKGFLIVQNGNKIIFSYDPLEQGTIWKRDSTESEDLSFLTTTGGNLFNLDYYYRGGLSNYQIQIRRVGRILIILLGSVFLLGLLISYLLTVFAYRPIGQIVDFFQHPEGHLSDRSDGNTEELKFIESSIVKMILSNRDLEERLAERVKSLRKLHYTALQLQLNPHFLHNTLESIYWNSIEVFKPEDLVPQSISSLSQFLRQVLSTNLMAIPLEEEVELTKNYGKILKCRFPDTIEIQWDIETSLNKVIVPKLLLQPLIENAFYHGIKPTRRGGTISINARKNNNILYLEVRDNGKGMAADKLRELQADFKEELPLIKEHIGLMNIYSRLKFLYGDMAGLEIESDGSSVTQVTILLSGTIPESKKRLGIS